MPASEGLEESELLKTLAAPSEKPFATLTAATQLAWLRRSVAKTPTTLACLELDNARVLFMPAELFIEYQLEAQRLRPDLFVAMAAYGEYGPGYIGTEIAYSQGGYETGAKASYVAPSVEKVLMTGIAELLNVPTNQLRRLP